MVRFLIFLRKTGRKSGEEAKKMSADREHHATKERKFQILIIPQGDAGEKRSFALTMGRMAAIVGGFVVVIMVAVALLLGYTPLGMLVPISNTQIQKRYGNQLYELQTRLSKVSEEFIVLREYNRKLRGALGEDLKKDTSASAVSDEAAAPVQGAAPQVQQQTEAEAPPRTESITAGVTPERVSSNKSFQASFRCIRPSTVMCRRALTMRGGISGSTTQAAAVLLSALPPTGMSSLRDGLTTTAT